MSAEYIPNEKRLKMFGSVTQGYAMDRVDMYLDKLEGAYTQLRTAYEQLKTAAQSAEAAAKAAQKNAASAEGSGAQMQQMQEMIAYSNRLKQENDALRQKAAEIEAKVAQMTTAAPVNPDTAIARALVAAQEKAEDILRGAQLEGQGIIAAAHKQVEQLQVEKTRAVKQLEGIRFAIDGLLREQPDRLG